MNLSEALNAALPELPARTMRRGYPKLDPVIVAREHVEEGVPVVMTLRPGTTSICNFTPDQWALIQLFDGERSYQDVSDAFAQVTGVQYSEEDVHQFADKVAEADLWYRSPQEKNIALMQKLQEERQKHVKKKSKFGDVAHMQFSAWDPDAFLTKVHDRFYWLYSGWFTALTLCLFVFTAYVFISNWDQIWRDTVKYYSFTEKSFADLAEFWVLFLIMGFFHESSHGLTCKHFGGGVHRMGFHLIYLTPAFFVDVTEAWVYSTKWERVATIAAGIWSELIFCSVGALVWWGTSPSSYAHEIAYKVILITGVAVVLVNLNPLIKIDGYYFFSELFGIQDIKERSTAYVSGLVKKYIWRMPAEIEYLPRKLRILFVPYALLSGLYSYMLLFFVVRFARNVFYKYDPQWAFVPALALAYFIFRSRIRTLVRFMQTVYLDKRELLRAWFKGPKLAAVSAVAAVVLLAPVWRDDVDVRFALEPAARAIIRAQVPGTVSAVQADEGAAVTPNQTLVTLRNLELESTAAQNDADLRVASARTAEAQLRYADLGRLEQERRALAEKNRLTAEEVSNLNLSSPIAGVVVTPRVRDRIGSYVTAGTALVEVADLAHVRARLYIPEFEMRGIRAGEPVRLHFDSQFAGRSGVLGKPLPASNEIVEGLVHKQDYKGLEAPRYYIADVVLDNPRGVLKDGMAGTAKVQIGRRSLAGFLGRDVFDFIGRKVW